MVRYRLATIAITISAVFTVACGSEASRVSLPKIYGGHPVQPGAYASTVGIARPDGDGLRLTCTGVLVAPDLVLTAGHCVHDVTDVTTLRLYAGDGEDGGLVAAGAGVLSVGVAPHFRRHPLGNADVALLRLATPMTGIEPAALSDDLDADEAMVAEGGNVTIVGYGEREDRARGLKFEVTTPVTSRTSHEIVAGGDGRDACQGDSGGPVFATSESGGPRLVGLVSRGIGLGCGDGGYISRLADHVCWLRSQGVPVSADPRLCPAATPSYADKDLTGTFARFCHDTALNPAVRHTVNAVVQALGAADCDAAASLVPGTTKLNLDHRFVSDLLPLAAFPQLTELSLVGNRVTDAGALRRLRALRALHVEGNDVLSLAPLAPLQRRGLVVYGTRRQVGNVEQTDFLRLCRDTTTSAAARLTIKAIFWKTMAEDCDVANERLLMLSSLGLSDRQLTDVTPLAGLQQLTRLDLSKNPLGDVHPLAGLERLKTLDLRATPVTDVSALEPLVARGLSLLTDSPQ